MLFHAKRRNVNAVSSRNKKRKQKVSSESTISSVMNIIIGEITTPHPHEQEIEVEVINEADEGSIAQESAYESSILVTFYVVSIILIVWVGFYSP
jgi:hypothetical protein